MAAPTLVQQRQLDEGEWLSAPCADIISAVCCERASRTGSRVTGASPASERTKLIARSVAACEAEVVVPARQAPLSPVQPVGTSMPEA